MGIFDRRVILIGAFNGLCFALPAAILQRTVFSNTAFAGVMLAIIFSRAHWRAMPLLGRYRRMHSPMAQPQVSSHFSAQKSFTSSPLVNSPTQPSCSWALFCSPLSSRHSEPLVRWSRCLEGIARNEHPCCRHRHLGSSLGNRATRCIHSDRIPRRGSPRHPSTRTRRVRRNTHRYRRADNRSRCTC